MTNTKNKLKAAVGLVKKDNKVLLVQLPGWYANEANKWVLPGGMVDRGETPLQAVTREIFEETNINVQKVEKIFETKDTSTEIYFFECEYESGEIIHQAEEIDSAAWFTPLQLQELDLGYNNYSLLKQWGYIS